MISNKRNMGNFINAKCLETVAVISEVRNVCTIYNTTSGPDVVCINMQVTVCLVT